VHQIEVHTSLTLGEILNNREAIGKIAKWAIKLSMYDIVYKPGTEIMAQALTDSWPSGQRLKHLLENERWNIRPSILTGPYNFKAHE
jgi:hypothetical protein